MHISRPLAALSAVALAATCLGSTAAAAAPSDRSPRPAPRGTALEAPRAGVSAIAREQMRRALVAQSHRGTTTFSVKSSRAATRDVRAAAAALGASTGGSGLAKLGWTTVTVPSSEAAATRARLEATPGVTAVSEAQLRLPDYTPNDPRYASQQTLMTAMQAPTAWDSAKGSGVTIAILDGGFDASHPDLSSKVTSTWDVVKGNSTVTDSPTDTVPGHGTAAASAAAAATNNSAGIAGAAPLANLMLIQVGNDTDGGAIFSDKSALGITYAVDHGADIISMSYGAAGSSDPAEADAVAYAIANDVLVVASAGNDGTSVPHYPAALTGVLAVGATTNNGTAQASWSTYGSWVDVAAPGESIPVALPTAADTDDGTVDGYSVWDGTSFSGPLVAGLAAVVRSYDPTATEAEVRTALTSTTKAITKTNSGYAHGLVQVASALTLVGDPTITAPAADDALTGRVPVSATSGAGFVRFSVDGTTVATKIATSAGSASGTLSTYGLSGAVTLRAQSCNATACGSGSTIGVTVSNDPPVLTSPADGAAIETSMTLAATSDGDAVKFLADGAQSLGVDKTAPFSLTIDTAALSDGAHTITAVQCSSDGLTCDAAHPSNARSITVSRLRPTVRVSPNPFSPNADGRRDTATVTYTNEVPQTPTIRVKTASGTVVRSTTLTTTTAKATGSHTWVWNGRNTAGNVVPDGTYTVELTTTEVGGVKKGAATTTVKIDKVKPVASSVTPSSTSVYPVVDGFRDSVTLGAKSNEAVGSYAVYITNSAGTRVRTITGGAKPAGRVDVLWKGTTNSGKRAADGVYGFQVLLQDVAGNQTLSAKGRVTLSWKKLTAKTGTKIVDPFVSSGGVAAIGACSEVFHDVRSGWTGSVGYYSDYYGCSSAQGDDLAAATHSASIPSAIKYGSVKVGAYGARAVAGYPDTADLVYFDTTGSLIDHGAHLSATEAFYNGDSVPMSSMLKSGRIKWFAGTVGGNWYDVKYFKITWTYYVLA